MSMRHGLKVRQRDRCVTIAASAARPKAHTNIVICQFCNLVPRADRLCLESGCSVGGAVLPSHAEAMLRHTLKDEFPDLHCLTHR
jgi:hypothetical protein